MKRIRFKIAFFLVVFAGLELSAQVNTIYYMTGIPQSNYLNPATQPTCNIFVGIPIISSEYFNLYNSTLGLDDLFWTNPETGELIHPLHPDANVNDFIEKFEDENVLRGDWSTDLLSFGFRIQNFYFTFDAVAKNTERFTYPKSLVDFIIRGNINGGEYDFSSLAVDVSEHIEYGIAVSWQISDQWQVGIRPKLLAGIAAMQWEDSDIRLETTVEEWNLNSDVNVNVSAPGLTIPTNPDGTVDWDNMLEFDLELNSFNDYKKLMTRNLGFGIDLGAHFFPMDELQLSLSVQDLGFIKWKSNTNTLSMNGTFTYIGSELNTADTSFTFEVLDTIKAQFTPSNAPSTFKTNLEPKIFVAARYFVLPQFDVGFVHRFNFPEEGFKYSLTLLADYRPTYMFSLSGSYTPIGGNARSFGFGLSVNLGPANVYLVTDYITTQYRVVEGTAVLLDGINHYTFRAGLNFVLGYNERKKLRKDKPMYYSDEY